MADTGFLSSKERMELMDYKNVKDKIVPVLVNAQNMAEFLKGKPHRKSSDMAMVYGIEISSKDGTKGSIALTDAHMKLYGITEEELHETALDNLSHCSLAFNSMKEVLTEIAMAEMGIGRDEAEELIGGSREYGFPMYIASNESRQNGAVAMLDSGFMDSVTKELGCEVYVLPSSVHEVICIPKLEGVDYRELEEIVKEVNSTQVLPEDKLSDYVYEYNSKTHELLRSDEGEVLKAEHGRVSVKEKLEEKKIVASGIEEGIAPKKEKDREMSRA